jgi:hypothetical protein
MEDLDNPLPFPLSHLLVVQQVRIRRSTTVEQHRLANLTSGGPEKQQKARHKNDQIRITRLVNESLQNPVLTFATPAPARTL